MGEHTYRQFDTELENIRSKVLQMGGLVEQQIIKAVEALDTGDKALISAVIEGDKIVNRYEVEIDEFCTQIIAKRQPAAGDLRVIHTVIKTITDLERIGDEAEKIARMARSIEEANRNHLPRIELKHMENSAISMLRGALDAFARLDAAGAAAVVREDETVDNEFRSVLRQLITHMMEDPRSISRALDLLFVSKALERIGDHSKNMCEYVIYMVKGRDVRHIGVDRLEAEARS
ncbi:MAG: phosphate signaling complex protein PhoU [Burkholderiales bacterium]|jgi:phosphate transport system protein|nr:phosphate signaling complex protein PhoU [Burkholderiales bacterium]MCA3162509.1 phosphate signaling complex protein PhoU [Burkholderiales bacterium]MCA3164008.1 phosphate signaling complex protein PhoU [Burkholderiales bacterium]MCA3166418.1 phosphate signaling complex protein PhoU [Burkholderiales bacterium]MCA3170846.1 phosphate signaling complex protein PhoU [Burkholderiales bacterium]